VALPGAQEEARAITESVLQGGQVSLESVRRRKDNTILNVSIVGAPVQIAGKQEAVYAIYRDITERKQVEEALRRSEEKFKTLIETTDTGFLILDAQGRVIDANKEFIRITGYDTLEEILGRSVSEWTAPHDRERNATEVKKCIEQGYIRNLEIDYVNRVGQITPIEINASVIGSGDSAKIFSLCRDITERKRAEETLHNERLLLRTLIDNIPDSIYSKDLACRKTLANLTELRYIGAKSEAEALGKDDFEVYPRELAERFFADDQSVMQTGKPVLNREEYLLDEKEQKRWLLSSKLPLRNQNGQIIGLVGIGRDITERKHAEEALKNSNKQLKKMYSLQNVIRKLNQFLLRCDNEDEIYKTICDTFMEANLIKFVWIGLIEEGTFDVKPVAYAGIEKEYINSIQAKWDNSLHGNGPTGAAIKTQKPVLIGNIRTDPRFMPWREEGLKRGYLSIISLPIAHESKVVGVLNVYSDEEDAFNKKDVEFLRELTTDIAIGIRSIRFEKNLKDSNKQLGKAMDNIIFIMAKMSESKDPYTAGHQKKVSKLATAIARKMGLSEDRIEALKFASLIHDIGKINIPGEILSKPAKLSETEFALIKEHPKTCYNIIKDIDFPWEIASIILQHHERLDGSGYPEGLKDKEILLESKILAVADAVEAMSSRRPYRAALGINKALEEISKNKGKLYDSDVVDACIKLFKKDRFKFE
jgi:PAS domain S-box-containing protein/putative nucleotidyltransferase with HDIG domain